MLQSFRLSIQVQTFQHLIFSRNKQTPKLHVKFFVRNRVFEACQIMKHNFLQDLDARDQFSG